MYLLYLVRFELVGLYTACTSHIPSVSESDPSSLCLCALVLRQDTSHGHQTKFIVRKDA